jgi:hypothetical protein
MRNEKLGIYSKTDSTPYGRSPQANFHREGAKENISRVTEIHPEPEINIFLSGSAGFFRTTMTHFVLFVNLP